MQPAPYALIDGTVPSGCSFASSTWQWLTEPSALSNIAMGLRDRGYQSGGQVMTSRKMRTTSKLKLSMAVGDYDRVRPLMDGAVQIDGVDPIFMNLPPEEIFFRAFRSVDFDICELSLSSFTVKIAEHNCPYVGIPAFVSRAFRHNSIYVRRDRGKNRHQASSLRSSGRCPANDHHLRIIGARRDRRIHSAPRAESRRQEESQYRLVVSGPNQRGKGVF